jgi:serine/threonine-protein kinase
VSPEQARGEGVDHRTDIYALGALLFELVTGRMVFEATNAADMIAQHLYQPPRSAVALNPHVPPQIDDVIRRMLAKDANQRPTLAQVRNELHAATLGVEVSRPGSHPASTPPRGMYVTPSPLHVTPVPPEVSHSTDATSPSTPARAVQTSLAVEPGRRSRLPAIILAAVAALGIGIAAVVVLGGSQSASQPDRRADEPVPPPAANPEALPAEVKPAEAKPAEAKPAEAKPAEIKPAEVKPAEVKPEDTEPGEASVLPSTANDSKSKRTHRKRKAAGRASAAPTPERPIDLDAPL